MNSIYLNPILCGAVLTAVFFSAAAFGAEPAAVATPSANDVKSEVKDEAKPAATKASPVRRAGTDRLDLDTTVVTGNRELPKVLYIVPWKRAELGDLPAQPLNSLLDEVLTPIDRDVFRREVTYYGALATTEGAAAGAASSAAAGSEK